MLKSFFVVLLVAAVFCSAFTAAQDEEPCGVNEARYPCGKRCEEKCGSPAPEYCKGIRCLPPFGCRCKEGYARNPLTNVCIPQEDCKAI